MIVRNVRLQTSQARPQNNSFLALTIALVSIGGVTAAAISGVMYWQAGVPFAGGAVIGLIAGRQLAHKLAVPRLQQAFSIVGIGAAIMLAVSVLGFHA